VIKKVSATSRVPYSFIERVTRLLIAAGLWINRSNPDMRPEFLGALVAGLVASLPSEGMQAVEAVKNLVNTHGIEVGDDYAVPSGGGTCSRWDAIYPLLGLGPDSPMPSNLLEFITKCISTMADMDAEVRNELASNLENAEWTLAICLDPPFAVLSWFETWPSHSIGLNKLDSTQLPPPRFARRRVSARWLPIDPELDLFLTPPKIGGLQRLVSIPFALLVTAAEICIEARRRMSGNDLPNSEPSPGSDGDDEGLLQARKRRRPPGLAATTASLVGRAFHPQGANLRMS